MSNLFFCSCLLQGYKNVNEIEIGTGRSFKPAFIVYIYTKIRNKKILRKTKYVDAFI